MAFYYPNRNRVVFYNRYPNYFTYPVVNNSACQLQVEAMEDNLVSKIQNAPTSGAADTLASLKTDANAITAQKAACNSSLGVVANPVVTYRTVY